MISLGGLTEVEAVRHAGVGGVGEGLNLELEAAGAVGLGGDRKVEILHPLVGPPFVLDRGDYEGVLSGVVG